MIFVQVFGALVAFLVFCLACLAWPEAIGSAMGYALGWGVLLGVPGIVIVGLYRMGKRLRGSR